MATSCAKAPSPLAEMAISLNSKWQSRGDAEALAKGIGEELKVEGFKFQVSSSKFQVEEFGEERNFGELMRVYGEIDRLTDWEIDGLTDCRVPSNDMDADMI